MKGLLASAAVAAVLAASGVANATTFDLMFTETTLPGNGCCGPFNVSAILTATWDGSYYDVTGITGTVTSSQTGTSMSYAITGLISPAVDPPGSTLYNGLFTYDNVIVKSGGGFTLSDNGLGFYTAAPSFYGSDGTGNPEGVLTTPSAVNLYYYSDTYTIITTASYDINSPNNASSFSLTAVPEPATWAMLGLGFAALGFAGYHKARAPRSLSL